MKQQQNHASVATSVGLALLCLLAYSQMRGLVYGAPILDETQAAGRPEPAGPPLLLLMDYNANDSLSFFCLTFPLVACESLPGDIFGRRWKTWSTRAGADAPGNTGQLPCDDLHWQGQNNPAVHEYMLPGGGKLFSGGKVENKIKVVVDTKVVQVGFWSLVSLAKMQSWDGGGRRLSKTPSVCFKCQWCRPLRGIFSSGFLCIFTHLLRPPSLDYCCFLCRLTWIGFPHIWVDLSLLFFVFLTFVVFFKWSCLFLVMHCLQFWSVCWFSHTNT